MKQLLEDIRVIDMTHVWFGPWCTLMLAEMGAEVIKVEPPWGSLGRLSEHGPMYGGASPTFHHLNLNKKDLSVNLKDPQGKDILLKLVEKTDVIVNNYVPGTMDRMGFGYETLREHKPDIIYAALSGFGETGPYSQRPSYAMIAESYTGFTRQQGDNVNPEGPPYTMTGAFGDLAPGTMAAMSIIAALRYRDKTGKGQKIDVAQIDTMFAYNVNTTHYFLSGKDEETRREEQEEIKKKSNQQSIGGIHPVKNGHIFLMGYRAKGMDALKKKLDVEEVTKEMIKEYIKDMTRDEAVAFFTEIGLPIAPINYASEATQDLHVIARDMIKELEHPALGPVKVVNFPVKFSETPGKIHSPPPLLGEHNDQILTEILGYTTEEIEPLYKEGVLSKNLNV
jgi:CoA:oxalate CoA-transferase